MYINKIVSKGHIEKKGNFRYPEISKTNDVFMKINLIFKMEFQFKYLEDEDAVNN